MINQALWSQMICCDSPESSWKRGVDQGFAIALKKGSSDYYLWRLDSKAGPFGARPSCQGQLTSDGNTPVIVDDVQDFEIGDLLGRGSRFLVALTGHGSGLIAWNLEDCEKQGRLTPAAALSLGDAQQSPEAGSDSSRRLYRLRYR